MGNNEMREALEKLEDGGMMNLNDLNNRAKKLENPEPKTYNHTSDGNWYTSNPPQQKCTKCNEFYFPEDYNKCLVSDSVSVDEQR